MVLENSNFIESIDFENLFLINLNNLISIAFIIFFILFLKNILNLSRKRFIKKAKTKKQIKDIELFYNLFKNMLWIIGIIAIFFSLTGGWASVSITVGLISAVIGFALQKPINCFAAWIVMILNRPIEIGDRIKIGNHTGDVTEITLTHIHLLEVGGLIIGNDFTKRTIIIPNSTIFDKDIVNFSKKDEEIAGQIIFTITYESDLKKAIKISKESVKEILNTDEILVRTKFIASGIDIFVNFMEVGKKIEDTKTKITNKIFEKVMNDKKVSFAYPHTEIVFKNKEERK